MSSSSSRLNGGLGISSSSDGGGPSGSMSSSGGGDGQKRVAQLPCNSPKTKTKKESSSCNIDASFSSSPEGGGLPSSTSSGGCPPSASPSGAS